MQCIVRGFVVGIYVKKLSRFKKNDGSGLYN